MLNVVIARMNAIPLYLNSIPWEIWEKREGGGGGKTTHESL